MTDRADFDGNDPPTDVIAVLLHAIARLEEQMRIGTATIQSAVERAASGRRLAIAGIMVGALGIAAAVVAIAFGVTAHATADKIVEFRTQSRHAQCIQENVLRDNIRDSAIGGIGVLGRFVPPNDYERVVRANDFIRDYAAYVHGKIRFRLCTPAGERRYYQRPPRDPVDTGTTTPAPTLPLPTTTQP